MRIRFLIDENLSPRLEQALKNMNADIDALRIGDPGAPPLGTLDPDILNDLQSAQRALVTDNRTSMPGHLTDHAAAGKHHGGIIWVRPKTGLKALVNALCLVWVASEAEEWMDRTDWLPY